MATYPGQNNARTTATARKATGMPVSPVMAYAVGITPAATVIGAIDAKMNASTASTPSLSRASARDTVLARAGAVCMDMESLLHLLLLTGFQVRCDITAAWTVIWVWMISCRSSGGSQATASPV